MNNTKALLLALILALFSVATVSAQTAESIWLEASNINYKTNETVTVLVNGASATPIQGFTFQIRYDPNCLKPLNASSPVAGMSGLQLPQNAGLVDASFASTTPQQALGVLAEVSFQALGGCQTELYLESAALAVRDASGFAVPLQNISLGERTISLNIDKQVGEAQAPAPLGAPLSLDVEAPSGEETNWAETAATTLIMAAIFLAIALAGIGLFALYKRSYSAS